MLTRTCELAIKCVVFLGLEGNGKPLSPKQIAKSISCSPSYLAKTTNLLVKAGILSSLRGINGGVLLAKPPEEISLLEIVEACQGLLVAGYCRDIERSGEVCSFHVAMEELHNSMVTVLTSWSVKDLMSSPARCPGEGLTSCKMFFEGCNKYSSRRRRQQVAS